MYRKLRNCVNMKEKQLKSDYYCRSIEDASGDGSIESWKAMKETLPSNNSNDITAVMSDAGKLETDPKYIAVILNDHFCSIGKRLAKVFRSISLEHQCAIPCSTSTLHPVSLDFVLKQLNQLKTNKAVGLANISARLLKDSASLIAPSLRYIINLSFQNGQQFPSLWKCGKVRALFKQGNRTDRQLPSSFCPPYVLLVK